MTSIKWWWAYICCNISYVPTLVTFFRLNFITCFLWLPFIYSLYGLNETILTAYNDNHNTNNSILFNNNRNTREKRASERVREREGEGEAEAEGERKRNKENNVKIC